MKKRMLVVDDDAVIRNAVAAFFEAAGYEISTAPDVASAQITFRTKRPDAAVIDFMLPDGDALELIHRFRAVDPNCPVIVLTGHGSIDLAVRAVQEGAAQFLTKPLDLPVLRTVVERCLAAEDDRRKVAAEDSVPGAPRHASPFIGESRAIRELEARVRRMLASDSPVLITGETGSGKGVLARWLHEHGPRASGPFVDLNCAGLSREFLDTELFGHEKGAFTGAVGVKQGLFEVAHGGTIFLDEIGDVDLQLQPKLLKIVEDKRFRRLGDVTDRTVDVRLVGATHRDIEAMSRDGRFRSDLFFRISTIPIAMPPLRERIEDIPLIATHLVASLCRALGRRPALLSADAIARLQEQPWTGNVRELRNVLERALLFGETGVIEADDLALPGRTASAQASWDTSLTLEQLERRYIELVFAEEQRNVDRTAARLGISRSSLYTRIRQYGLTTRDGERSRSAGR